MMSFRVPSLLGPAFALGVAMLAAIPSSEARAWEPTKPVEIIVPAGAGGGGAYQMARVIQAAVNKHKLLDQKMIVSLKGGASGAEGLMDMKASGGDPHKFIIAQSALYTLPFSTNLPFSWRDLTPIAILAMDEFALWVNAEAPYKTAQEFLDAARTADGRLRMGGTGSKREDHIITSQLERVSGAKFTYIPYKSGGEVATQLVGKNIEATVNNPSENVAQWRGGQVRPLCVFDRERIANEENVTDTLSWNDLPTCRESGLDVEHLMLRAILLPGDVEPEAVAFYEDLMKKVTETPEWKEHMAKNALKPVFITGEELTKFLEADEAKHKAMMSDAGFLAGSGRRIISRNRLTPPARPQGGTPMQAPPHD
jgi:putative tricarboxylic transport membrane protein